MNAIQLQPTKSYSTREYSYDRFSQIDLADGVLSLNVTRGRKVVATAYDVQCERDDRGVLNVVYLAKQDDPDGQVYGVELSPTLPLEARCNCSGFGRWKECKHCAAVLDLFKRGYLEAVDDEGDPDSLIGWTDSEIEMYEEYLAVENRIKATVLINALLGHAA